MHRKSHTNYRILSFRMRVCLALVLLVLQHCSADYYYNKYIICFHLDAVVIIVVILIILGLCSIPFCIIACIYCARQGRTDQVYANNYDVSPYAPAYAPYPPAYPAYPP
ncbi:hypothetical protein PFISCL1PPCAC_5369, partial [Pristionchus fissidentatus]